MADAPMSHAADLHLVTGQIALHRVRWGRYPTHQLVHDGSSIADVGSIGWLRIYLGWGSRVVLGDGTRWRIRAVTMSGYVRPVVVDTTRRKVALGAGGEGVYGITGREFGYTLNPGAKPHRRDAVWVLRHHENDVAEVRRRPMRFDSTEPVHIGAVLLSFVMMRNGVPDDARLRIPQVRWN